MPVLAVVVIVIVEVTRPLEVAAPVKMKILMLGVLLGAVAVLGVAAVALVALVVVVLV